MAVAKADYGRMSESLRYVTLIASELDTERPGALPELFDSPDYKYFQDFKSRAMVMQAWSSYGVEWPVIYHFLGVRPNIPEREISVLPDLPPEWPTLSAQNIRVAVQHHESLGHTDVGLRLLEGSNRVKIYRV